MRLCTPERGSSLAVLAVSAALALAGCEQTPDQQKQAQRQDARGACEAVSCPASVEGGGAEEPVGNPASKRSASPVEASVPKLVLMEPAQEGSRRPSPSPGPGDRTGEPTAQAGNDATSGPADAEAPSQPVMEVRRDMNRILQAAVDLRQALLKYRGGKKLPATPTTRPASKGTSP